MLITLISDTHCRHDKIDVGSGGMLIHAGDSTIYGEEWEMQGFIDWFRKQPFKYKIFINGNHEVIVEKKNLMPRLVEGLEHENVFYLENSGIEIEGLKIWGSPNTPEFFNWAYMYPRSKAKEQWHGMPQELDILITHSPPFGVMDKVRPIEPQYPSSYAGCAELTNYVISRKPKLHVFGHIHEHHGVVPGAFTTFVNAASCDGTYKPVNKPIVVDSDTWKVVE